MRRIRCIFNALYIVCCVYVAVGIASGQDLIFSDDFEKGNFSPAMGEQGLVDKWKLDSPHSWKVEEGTLLTTRYGGSAGIQKDLGGRFVVEARVKAIEPDPELSGGFGGLTVYGIKFVIRPDGFWWPYKRPGDARGVGDLKKTRIDLDKWYNFKIVRRHGGVFEWFVDGEKICELFEPSMKGDTGVAAWRFKMAYDYIRVYRIEEEATDEDTEINILRNSSFETIQDGIPLYWGPTDSHPYITYGSMENFFRQWRIDTEEKLKGSNSVRLEKEGGLQSYCFSAERGEPYIFSVYLRSDRENVPARLQIWEWDTGQKHTKEVKVGKDWKRHESIIEKASGYLRVIITLTGEGVIWIDAPQLEKGIASTPYRMNPLDRIIDEKTVEIETPEMRVKKASSPLKIDGKLDDAAWSDAAQPPPFLKMATRNGERKMPSEKTDVFTLYDNANLYIGFRCWDSQIENLQATVKEDGGAVWRDDCVEVFIDVNLDRTTFYHFVVNALGAKYIQDKVKNIPWAKEDWHAAAHIDKEYWTAEIAIPLAALGIDNLTSERWGINLGRENHKITEYSCTAPVLSDFHDVQRYGFLRWPDRNVFARHLYKFEDMALKVDNNSGHYVLDGIVRNSTGKKAEIIIEGEIAGVKHCSRKIVFGTDVSEHISFGRYPVKENEKVIYSTINIIDAVSRERLKTEKGFVKISPLIETALERSYYTTEENARLIYVFNMDREYLKGKRVKARIRNGDNILIEKNLLWQENVNEILLPIRNIPAGEYIVEISLIYGERETAKSSESLRKLEPGTSEVKIDRLRRVILVDENPFFVFAPLVDFYFGQSGFYKEGWEEKIEKTIKHWADHGFKSISIAGFFTPFAVTEKGWAKFFEIADKYDLKVVAFPIFLPIRHKHMEKLQEFEEFVGRFKNERSLLAWYVIDEPETQENVTPEMVIKVVDTTRKADPYHPVYINFTYLGPGQRWGGLPGDIISTDFYITGGEGRSIKEVIDLVKLKEDVTKERRLPVWMYLVGNNLFSHKREPTPDEQEAQTYGAMIAGCTGLKYFSGQPVGKGHWERYQRLNQELQQLTPVIFSPEKIEKTPVSSPSVLVMTRKYKGDVYLISVNIGDRETNAVFDLSGLVEKQSSSAEVLFEGRVIKTKNSLLEDVFEPFRRHVYRISPDR